MSIQRERESYKPQGVQRLVVPVVPDITPAIRTNQGPNGPLTTMQDAVQEFLSREDKKGRNNWERELGEVVELVDAAARTGRIPDDAGLTIRQVDLMTTLHSFKAAALSATPTRDVVRPVLDFPHRYATHNVSKEDWFNGAMQRARNGDWRPLMDYFDKFVRNGVYFGLRINFGVYSEEYDGGKPIQGEDIVQDSWLKTIEHFDRLDFPNPYYFHAWFRRLATNRMADISRKKPPFEELSIEQRLIRDEGLRTPADRSDIWRAIEIRKAILKLQTSKQKKVLILKFFSGYSNYAVAQILGITEGAVKSLQHRGLDSMGRALSDTYFK